MRSSRLLSPTTEFVVRRAKADDGAGILACLGAAFNEYRSAYTEGAFADTVLTPAAVDQRLRTQMVYVAVSPNGRIIGTLTAILVDDTNAHLRGMAVHPQFQAGGVGTQLLAAAVCELRAQGCRRVTLDTTEPLVDAVRFYQANGFRKTGQRSTFFGMTLTEYARELE